MSAVEMPHPQPVARLSRSSQPRKQGQAEFVGRVLGERPRRAVPCLCFGSNALEGMHCKHHGRGRRRG
jgi:hypothetical protein